MNYMDKLLQPLAGDLVNYLSKFDPNTPVRIIDPDTGWIIENFIVTKENEYLCFTGEYPEMVKSLEKTNGS